MLSFSVRTRRIISVAFLAGVAVGAAACSVYDVGAPERATTGGASGAGGSHAGIGGASGNGGAASAGGGGSGSTGGTGGDGMGGTRGSPDGSTGDAARGDAVTSDDTSTDDVRDDATGPVTDGGTADIDFPDADAPVEAGDPDATAPPVDATTDAPPGVDAATDATVDGTGSDTAETGVIVQILPRQGTPIVKPDAGAPFDSRCASDEVVTGFIASTCSKLIGGVLSSPHNLPLVGNTTGGSAVTIACPANYVAVGIVGRYGHSTMWMENITTSIGVVCKDLGSTTTQIVAITTEATLDSGYTSFREDCTSGLYLTDISGQPDSNSLAYTPVGQVGGECSAR
jgi:hypothetical protein